jgi:hypothetical protein
MKPSATGRRYLDEEAIREPLLQSLLHRRAGALDVRKFGGKFENRTFCCVDPATQGATTSAGEGANTQNFAKSVYQMRMTGHLHVRAACVDDTVRGAPSPPHTSIAPVSASFPSARFECCTGQHPGFGGSRGKPIQDGVPEMQRDPKAKPPCPTDSNFLRDCHLSTMD